MQIYQTHRISGWTGFCALYSEKVFERFANDEVLRIQHLLEGRDSLANVFSEDEMRQIENMIC